MKKKLCLALATVIMSSAVFIRSYEKQQVFMENNISSNTNPAAGKLVGDILAEIAISAAGSGIVAYLQGLFEANPNATIGSFFDESSHKISGIMVPTVTCFPCEGSYTCDPLGSIWSTDNPRKRLFN